MIERLLIAAVMVILGGLAYRVYVRWQLNRISAQPQDPILTNIEPTRPTIVYFTTPGCIPCITQQQPALERLTHILQGNVQVVKIDATMDPDAAKRWGVMTAPTTFVLDQTGKPFSINFGATDEFQLKRQIDAVFVA